jgi:hypothetical protein
VEQSGNVAQHEPDDDVDEITFFAPIRPTAARSLRPGDEILVPTGEDPFPQVAYRARITDIRDDEASGMITINGEFVGETSGLFEKPAYPAEVFQRLLRPGGPAPGTESIMVRGEELWKWLGTPMNDPNGSSEQYIIRTFKRVHEEEIGGEAIEVKLQSVWNPKKVNTVTMLPSAPIGFKGHR